MHFMFSIRYKMLGRSANTYLYSAISYCPPSSIPYILLTRLFYYHENQYSIKQNFNIHRRSGAVHPKEPKRKLMEQQMEMDWHQMIHLCHSTVHIIRSHLVTVLRPEVFQPNSEKSWGNKYIPLSSIEWTRYSHIGHLKMYATFFFSCLENRNSTTDNGRSSPERPPSPVLVPGILKNNVAFFENLKRN